LDLDLRQLLRIAQRRGWLIVALALIAGAAAYFDASRDTPMYQASATMLVSQPPSVGLTDMRAPYSEDRVLLTYQMLITSDSMRALVADALGMESLPTTISASTVRDTQLIVITTTDADPDRAALVANTLVTEFQTYVNEQALERAHGARAELEGQVEALEGRLSEVDGDILALNTPENLDDVMIQQRIVDLGQERSRINQTLIDLNTQAVTLDSSMLASTAQVELSNPAVAPASPFMPVPQSAMSRGVMAGLLLGIAVVALLEYLDNTVKPERPLHVLTGAPVLASVPLMRLRSGSEQLFTVDQPASLASESIRLLRTNLEFAAASEPIGSVAVTSPGAGEGKSTVCANLAVAMAQAGKRTVLIDADMRKPTQQMIFGISNAQGLTTLLTDPAMPWTEQAASVALPGLRVITSGPIPPNPSDLVSSARFEALVGQIKSEVDLVIIDSPPVLAASDALAIATHTDGVILVCQSHVTRVDALRHAARSIHQGEIRVVGCVLNQQKGTAGASFYGEYYGHPAASPSH
jgi:polysaccharide biosynthesis transport protein